MGFWVICSHTHTTHTHRAFREKVDAAEFADESSRKHGEGSRVKAIRRKYKSFALSAWGRQDLLSRFSTCKKEKSMVWTI
jgi:hypothetical protein